MKLLNFIFGKPIKIENGFFGTMVFQVNKKEPLRSYFECKRHFHPSNKTIEIALTGDVIGPTQTQIDFFKEVEDRYSDVAESIIPLIENEFRNWHEGFKITNFQKEFEPVYLEVPRCVDKPIVWEIAFESYHDRNHTFTITMNGFNATDILIDG